MNKAILLTVLGLMGAPLMAHDGPDEDRDAAERPAALATESLLRAPLTLAPGIEVIMQDLQLEPNAQIPPHYHPGQEFLYLLEGTVTYYEDGIEPVEMHAGDSYVIPERAVHYPRVGPEGGRAIIFRVHMEGEPERYAVDRDIGE